MSQQHNQNIQRPISKTEKTSQNIFQFNQLFDRNKSKNIESNFKLKKQPSLAYKKQFAKKQVKEQQNYQISINNSNPLDQFITPFNKTYDHLITSKNRSFLNNQYISQSQVPFTDSIYLHNSIYDCFPNNLRFKSQVFENSIKMKNQLNKSKVKQDIINYLESQNANLNDHRNFLIQENKKLKQKLRLYKEEIKNNQITIQRLQSQNKYFKEQYLSIKDQLFRGINRKIALSLNTNQTQKQVKDSNIKELPLTNIHSASNTYKNQSKQNLHFSKTNPFTFTQIQINQNTNQSPEKIFAQILDNGVSPSKFKINISDKKTESLTKNNKQSSTSNVKNKKTNGQHNQELSIEPICQNQKINEYYWKFYGQQDSQSKQSKTQSYLLSPKHTQMMEDLGHKFKQMMTEYKNNTNKHINQNKNKKDDQKNNYQLAHKIREIRQRTIIQNANKNNQKSRYFDDQIKKREINFVQINKNNYTQSGFCFSKIKNIKQNGNNTMELLKYQNQNKNAKNMIQ